MKFQEIDRLAQSVDKLPDIANLGDRYVYHCLREVYDRYLAGKLEKEEAEAERRKLYQAHRLYREQEAAHLKAHKQIQEAIRQAGEMQSEIYKGLGALPAEQLLGLCCRCISAMTGRTPSPGNTRRNTGGTSLAKRLTVEDWLNVILPAEEKSKQWSATARTSYAGRKVPAGSALTERRGVLEARVLSVEITKARITIQAKPKDITV